MPGCLACDLTSGRADLPGGLIHESGGWQVEHCVGPLGVGTLVVKPRRHVLHVAHLTEPESLALGPLLRRMTAALTALLHPDQVYVCLWSHAGGRPGHIHFVVQPVPPGAAAHGPDLQALMFAAGDLPDPAAVSAFADRLRAHLAEPPSPCTAVG